MAISAERLRMLLGLVDTELSLEGRELEDCGSHIVERLRFRSRHDRAEIRGFLGGAEPA